MFGAVIIFKGRKHKHGPTDVWRSLLVAQARTRCCLLHSFAAAWAADSPRTLRRQTLCKEITVMQKLGLRFPSASLKSKRSNVVSRAF